MISLPRPLALVAASVALAGTVFTSAGVAAPSTPRKKSSPAQTKSAKSRATPKASPSPSATKAKAATPTPTPKPQAIPTPAPTTPTPNPKYGPNVSLEPGDLVEFAKLDSKKQALIRSALELTGQNLTYTFGSAEPSKGGMDCSGTIYYLLRSAGYADVPRDSAGQYVWTRKRGVFHAVIGKSEKSFEFEELEPGDLLFWSGTYQVEREFPITHVMLYLGTERKTKRRVMFGASDGRTYAGVPRWGVSVFDFRMPKPQPKDGGSSRVVFVGYGSIPGLRSEADPKKDAAKSAQ